MGLSRIPSLPERCDGYKKMGLDTPDQLSRVIEYVWEHYFKNPDRVSDAIKWPPSTFDKIRRFLSYAGNCLAGTLEIEGKWADFLKVYKPIESQLASIKKKKQADNPDDHRRPGHSFKKNEIRSLQDFEWDREKQTLVSYLEERGATMTPLKSAGREVTIEHIRNSELDFETYRENTDRHGFCRPVIQCSHTKPKVRGGRNKFAPDVEVDSLILCDSCAGDHVWIDWSKVTLDRFGNPNEDIDLNALKCLVNIWASYEWQLTGPHRPLGGNMKLIHSWGKTEKRFQQGPVGKKAYSKLVGVFCERAGLSRRIGYAHHDCRPTYVQSTIGALKQPLSSVRAITLHTSEENLNKFYYDNKLIEDVNHRLAATLVFNQWCRGEIENAPKDVRELYQDLVDFHAEQAQSLTELKRAQANTAIDVSVIRETLEKKMDNLDAEFKEEIRKELASGLEKIETKFEDQLEQQTVRIRDDFKQERVEFKKEMTDFKQERAEFKQERAEFKQEMGVQLSKFKTEMKALMFDAILLLKK
jgi:hypothetical protein